MWQGEAIGWTGDEPREYGPRPVEDDDVEEIEDDVEQPQAH
jgi:hypothetical protein